MSSLLAGPIPVETLKSLELSRSLTPTLDKVVVRVNTALALSDV
jgi:hypothetical protein